MDAVGLDPWYTYGDERYFSVLNGSGTANAQINMSLLYDRYYDRAESLAVTELEVIEAHRSTVFGRDHATVRNEHRDNNNVARTMAAPPTTVQPPTTPPTTTTPPHLNPKQPNRYHTSRGRRHR